MPRNRISKYLEPQAEQNQETPPPGFVACMVPLPRRLTQQELRQQQEIYRQALANAREQAAFRGLFGG